MTAHRSFRVLLAACTALLVACTGTDRGGSTTPKGGKPEWPTDATTVKPARVEAPPPDALHGGIGTYGGRLMAAMISDPKTFNLALAQETSSTTPLGFLFEGMAETNALTGKMQEALAEKWEVSKDNLTYTFTLRKGLQWSDGKPLTADDVDFTFNRIVFNPDIPTDWRDILTIGDALPTVRKLDNLRIQVRTPKPFAPFLRTFAALPILPKHALEASVNEKDPKTGKPRFNEMWTIATDVTTIPGSGPFMFAEFVPSQRIVYKRNPYYWRVDGQGNRLPYLDGMVIFIVKDQNAGVLKFTSGETDVLFVDAPLRGQDFGALQPKQKTSNFTIYQAGPDFGTLFLTFNQTRDVRPNGTPYVDKVKGTWFRDIRFRRALAHAIDKQSIIRNVYLGIAQPQISCESQTSPFYSKDVTVYPFDLAKAQNLLAEAGYRKDAGGVLRDPAGHAVSFTLNTNSENSERKQIAQILKSDFAKLGIDIKFQPITFNVLVEKTSSSLDWEAVLMGFTGSLDPANGRNIWHSEGRLHMFNQKLAKSTAWQPEPWEKEVDRLFEKGATTLDETKRKEIYHGFQRLVSDQVPYLYIANRIQLYPVRNRFGNLKVTPIGGPIWNIWGLYMRD
ncbi:MAG: ABC transporter substrate-binding protein [Candidatus Sericytochromatia bacterium]|nr:ABC transporter substrate-binding protein [Candidatus Sericytochromatia bacterium]